MKNGQDTVCTLKMLTKSVLRGGNDLSENPKTCDRNVLQRDQNYYTFRILLLRLALVFLNVGSGVISWNI